MQRMERSLTKRRRRMTADLSGRVLEVGVGTGATLRHYPAGTEVVGIDLSPEMLDLARRRASELGNPVELREMDAQKLDFPDGSFDAILFTLCLCTIPDPGLAIREALRVARPGAPVRMLEHVRSDVFPVALLQDAVNPFTVLFQRDHFNRRTFDTAARAGVQGLTEERWFLGLFALIQGRAPAS
jgi:ubiquinone/menaquinone biosynthesis C-methylase UbiE